MKLRRTCLGHSGPAGVRDLRRHHRLMHQWNTSGASKQATITHSVLSGSYNLLITLQVVQRKGLAQWGRKRRVLSQAAPLCMLPCGSSHVARSNKSTP